jgi:hypothetical protein
LRHRRIRRRNVSRARKSTVQKLTVAKRVGKDGKASGVIQTNSVALQVLAKYAVSVFHHLFTPH